MKISVFQTKPVFGEFNVNANVIKDYIDNSDADILVFPELAFSGYNFETKEELKKLSNGFNSRLFNDEIKYLSKEKNKIICLGFAEERVDGEIFNSAALFFPNGEKHLYRKTHLFYKERYLFSEGNTGFNVFRYEPWDINIGMMICYDWRFPEAARTLGIKGADVILCPSNLVTDVWHISMPSRALENNLFFVTANRVGTETNSEQTLDFTGKSAIYGCRGELLCQASNDQEEVITADIDYKLARKNAFNEINDIFTDRRPDIYFK